MIHLEFYDFAIHCNYTVLGTYIKKKSLDSFIPTWNCPGTWEKKEGAEVQREWDQNEEGKLEEEPNR